MFPDNRTNRGPETRFWEVGKCAQRNCLNRGVRLENLGPNTDKLDLKLCTETQSKARRTNQIAFPPLPWAQGHHSF